MNVATVLEKYTHRLEMDNSMLNSQNDYPSRLLLREVDELKIIIEALKFQQSLVKCKDCLNRKGETAWCMAHNYVVMDDDYCSRGERRCEE